MTNRLILVAVLFACAPAVALRADEPAPRTDRYGDLLPQGAICRMGTIRLRNPGRLVLGGVLAYSPDSRMLASATAENVRLWDSASGKLVRVLYHSCPFPESVVTVAFAPGGKTLATGDSMGFVRVWDITTGKQDWSADRTSGPVACVGFSSDGQVLVSTGEYGTIELWHAATGKLMRRLSDSSRQVTATALSADGALLARAANRSVAWIGLPSANNLGNLRLASGERVNALALSPDGKRIALAQPSGAYLWDIASPTPVLRARLANSIAAPANAVAFSANGTLMASAGLQLTVWKTTTGALDRLLANGYYHAVAFSPNGRLLAAMTQCGTVEVWNVHTGKRLLATHGHEMPVRSIAFAPDGTAAVSAADFVGLWDIRTGKELARLSPECHASPDGSWRNSPLAFGLLGTSPEGFCGGFCRLATFSPRGNLIIASYYGGSLRDATGKVLRNLTVAGKTGRVTLVEGGLCTFGSIVVGKESTTGEKLHFWDSTTGDYIRTIDFERSRALAVSRDGRLLASSSKDSLIRIWDGVSGKRLRGLPVEGAISAIVFAGNGQFLASGGHRLIVWDIANGNRMYTFDPIDRADLYLSIAFSRDGRLIAGGGTDRAVYLWETLTGKPIRRYVGHSGSILALEFSPDMTLLASGSEDTSIVMWSMADGAGELPVNLDRLWLELGGTDAGRAWRVIHRMSSLPDRVVPFLATQLRPIRPTAAQTIIPLIRDLDDPVFAKRERAFRQLRELGESARPALASALNASISEEVRRRTERLIGQLDQMSPEDLATLRAIAILERIGTRAARSILEAVAQGCPEARVTREAKHSLDRITSTTDKHGSLGSR